MARVAITSAVYLGDVAPFIPIGRRLVERGHDVTFVAPAGFRPFLEPEPFRIATYALDSSPAAMNADPVHQRLMRHPTLNAARLARYWMKRTLTDDGAAATRSLTDALDDADVVVTHPTFGVLSVPVAHSLGLPVVVGHLFPMMIPTAAHTPPLGSRSPSIGRRLNRFVWNAFRFGSGVGFDDRGVNAIRASVGARPFRGNAGWAWAEADATVVLASRHYYGEAPPDWPPVAWGGFSVWDGPAGRPLDPALDEYVGDGADPPVLVTLGTSAATDAGSQFARIAAGLSRRGLRSVLLVGHATNMAHLTDHPAARPFAPVTALLPRCRVAVVSGALGGIAAALSAGVPVVVHPQLFDQVWHGGQVERLGVGRMARRTRDVAAAVAAVAADPAYAERARTLAARMADEDGPSAVARAVEELLGA